MDDLEKGIKKFLRTISISPEYLEWGLKYLEQDKDLRGESKRAILNTHKQNLEQALKRLDGLLEMRMNKEVSEEEYAKKKQALEAEKEKHEQVINQFEKVEATLGSNATLYGGNVFIQAAEPFEVLTLATKAISNLQPTFEPNNHSVNKREKHALSVLNPIWLRYVERIRIAFVESKSELFIYPL